MARYFLIVLFFTGLAAAQDSTVAPLLRLLQSGRLPKERQPQVVEMICKRGGEAELAFVFEQALKPDAFTPQLRVQALNLLADAAQTRKVKPSGDLSGIEKLVQLEENANNAELALAAMKLASTWKVAETADELSSLAVDAKANDRLRRAAIEGLARIGTDQAKQVLTELAGGKGPANIRMFATAGLAEVDLQAASKAAANVLASASADDDPDAMLQAFFLRKEGTARLAAALKTVKLQPDVAKRALRSMYSVGHNDAELSSLLSEMAGIAADMPPPSPEEALKIAAEVAAKGDAARGEQIFRRADLSCMNCHAIHRAGGQVGPDLSNVGRISPVDYIVNSILNPNLAIKEAYVTRVIETSDGKVVQGVAADRDNVRVVLRTADGKTVVVPVADIDTEEEGQSLMPQGITKFLTHQEFLDLAKFVSELGKEGTPYAPPTTATIQRWRFLAEPHSELLSGVPNVEQVREYALDAPEEAWKPAYAMVSGKLPVRDFKMPLYLLGEIDVSVEGELTVQVETTDSVQAWLDATPFDPAQPFTSKLTAGRHKLLVRVEPAACQDCTLRVSLSKPEESSAQFDIVAGQ